jgi:hypothetical protein
MGQVRLSLAKMGLVVHGVLDRELLAWRLLVVLWLLMQVADDEGDGWCVGQATKRCCTSAWCADGETG